MDVELLQNCSVWSSSAINFVLSVCGHLGLPTLIINPFIHRTPWNLTNACLPHLTNSKTLFFSIKRWILMKKAFYSRQPSPAPSIGWCENQVWSRQGLTAVFVRRPSGDSISGCYLRQGRISPEELQPGIYRLVDFVTKKTFVQSASIYGAAVERIFFVWWRKPEYPEEATAVS